MTALEEENILSIAATREKGLKGKIQRLSSPISGIALRVARHIGLDLHIDTLHPFVSNARRFTQAAIQEDKIQAAKEQSRARLTQILEQHEGIRGIEFQDEGVGLSIHPSKRVEYDRELLRKGLGDAYSAIVHEDVTHTISVPSELKSREGHAITPELITIMVQSALHDLGIYDAEKIMTTQVKLRVDAERLEELEETGKIQLPEGTRRVKRTWNFRPYPLNKWENRI